MGWHAVSTQLLIESSRVDGVAQVWLVDDAGGGRSWMGSYPGTTNSKKLAESGDIGV